MTAHASNVAHLPESPTREHQGRETAHIIKTDAEAIVIAHQVATEIAKEASIRDKERRLPRKELDLFSS
ncbi:MAG: SfnB family sulfur acquisition oxidoreductase, partial [Methylophilus sp.]